MLLCRATSLLDLGDVCVRDTWAALVPTLLVLAFCAVKFHPPFPPAIRRLVHATKAPFKEFLTLREAEGLLVTGSQDVVVRDVARYNVPVWRPLLVVIGLAQSALSKLLLSTTWMYTVVRAATHVTATPPYDLFLSAYVFEYNVAGVPLPGRAVLWGLSANIAATLLLLLAVLRMPLGVPSGRTDVSQIGVTISVEDYTPLWQWITFSWVYPLIKKGTTATLADRDVFELSPNIQSRPVFIKFSSLQLPTLLQKLWVANSLDITVDFVLTVVNVFFNYAGPFFLKCILDAIDTENATPRDRGTAYVYAVLMLHCAVLKAQCDLQHLWHSRRASTRIRVELIAAVYDKALKRKDFSGLVDKDKAREAAERKAESQSTSPKATQTKAQKQAQNAKAETPRRARTRARSGAYNIYGAPIEILVGSAFLYELLGWSAFAGFVVLLVGWPLNSYVARRRVRMHRGELKARDGRMSVVNELIGSVKFIKFFAWEERWIKRALDAREVEMKWMIKSRLNSLMFFLIWALAPILLSTISFLTYVILGNQLAIGTAFTSIALFGMIRSPLNVIPSWVEDEVSRQDPASFITRSATTIIANHSLSPSLPPLALTWSLTHEQPDVRRLAAAPQNGNESIMLENLRMVRTKAVQF
ncbi:ABC transporter type 1, transmembrane domain-containing protein [Mycena olivaceomarginata]|nr:ABC transporter type 1, transmembrane domain-containing protein [Mycena olivaceomarginata]